MTVKDIIMQGFIRIWVFAIVVWIFIGLCNAIYLVGMVMSHG